MKDKKETQTIDPFLEKIRILNLSNRLGKKFTNRYYAEKLNRTDGAISQALNGYPNSIEILKRIHRHNDWLERQNSKRKLKIAA